MKTYTITDSSGRALELTVDVPPTKDQIDRIFAYLPPPGLDFTQPLTPENRARAEAARKTPGIISLQDLERALIAADTAGDKQAATVFANEIHSTRAATQAPQTAMGRAAQAERDSFAPAQAQRESMAPYWIAGGMVVFVVVLILLRKLLVTRPWRVIPQAVRSAVKMKDKVMCDLSDLDAEWFAKAEDELFSGNIDKATWARALVKAGGNEEKRKVEYILLRVKKMRLSES